MDTGNFFENRYPHLEQLALEAVFVQAKTYYGGGIYYRLEMHHTRVAKVYQNANYRSYISVELERIKDPMTSVPKSLAILRSAVGKKQMQQRLSKFRCGSRFIVIDLQNNIVLP